MASMPPTHDGRPARRPSLASHLTRLVPHPHIISILISTLHLQLHTPSSCCSGFLFPLPSQFSISLDCPFFHRLFRSLTLLRTPNLDLRSYPWPHLSRFNKYLTTDPTFHNQRVDIIGQVQCWYRHTCNYNLRSSQSLEIPPHSLTIYQLTHPFITICNRPFHFNQISLDAPRHNTQARTS